ncbi:hypothetical protein Q5X77_00065 [Acinetobacter baumannii]|nr:hypothetical protein [Acinetobacter baumannii]
MIGTVGDLALNVQLAGMIGQNTVGNTPADRRDAKANANQLYNSACASADSAVCGVYIRKATSQIG